MKTSTTFWDIALVFVLCNFLSGCGGSGSGIGTSDTFSADASFGSPFESSSGLATQDITRPFLSTARTYEERREEIADLLAEDTLAECVFDFDLSNQSGQADCYSPNIDVTGSDYPDTVAVEAVDFDLLFGDAGIWDSIDDSSGEACAAAQVNELVNVHAGRSHFANLLGAAVNCFIRNQGSLSFPSSEGDALEFEASALTEFKNILEAASADSFEFSSIVVTKITGTNPAYEGYRYEITGEWSDVQDPGTTTYGIVMKAQHLVKDTNEIKGSLSYVFQKDSKDAATQCEVGVTTESYAGDLLYEKESATSMKMRVNSATFCGAAEPLSGAEDHFTLDPCDQSGAENTDGWAQNWNRVVMNFNPSTFDGSFVFNWQAGRNDRASRTFNAEVETDGDTRTATAWVGYDDPIQDAKDDTCTGYSDGLGTIDGFICNWSGPGHKIDGTEIQDFIQTQVLSFDTTDEDATWTVTSEKIKFAPVTACSFDPATFNDLQYTSGDAMSNDVEAAPANEAATIDLEDIANYAFDLPSEPSL